MTEPILYATLGRTTAGKTTLSKYLKRMLNITYIPEAEIKRRMVSHYGVESSLSEELRDIAYKEAAKLAGLILSLGNNVLIDAAFHKHFRRKWLYEETKEIASSIFLFYCKCENLDKTIERINLRKSMAKNAETQADSMEVYNFINTNFDEPIRDSEGIDLPFYIFYIDTNKNIIDKIESYNQTEKSIIQEKYIGGIIKDYLTNSAK